jgi:hypothetical protein
VAALPPRLQPLELLLDVLNDASLSLEVRLNAARWAAPYVHHHKGQVDTSGRDAPLQVMIVKFNDVRDEIETNDRMAEPKPVTIEHDPLPTSH